MGNHVVESLGKIEEDDIRLFLVIHRGSRVMDCVHELCLAGQSSSKSMLVMEGKVVSPEVFPHAAKNNMFHHLAHNACQGNRSIIYTIAVAAFLGYWSDTSCGPGLWQFAAGV